MSRLEQLEHSQSKIHDDYVTHKHLEAVVNPLQKLTEEIQRDIKKILLLVKKTNNNEADRY